MQQIEIILIWVLCLQEYWELDEEGCCNRCKDIVITSAPPTGAPCRCLFLLSIH